FARLRRFLRHPLRAFGGRKSASETGDLKLALERVAAGQEFDHLRLFQADLQRFLHTNGCRACDHVFLPTAQRPELVAIQEFLKQADPSCAPTFHLEFRHDLDVYSAAYRDRHHVFFAHALTAPADNRLRLYTDTEELAQRLAFHSDLHFDTLPIPFRSRL